MLESDQELGSGTMYMNGNPGKIYTSMKQSKIFEMARGTALAMIRKNSGK